MKLFLAIWFLVFSMCLSSIYFIPKLNKDQYRVVQIEDGTYKVQWSFTLDPGWHFYTSSYQTSQDANKHMAELKEYDRKRKQLLTIKKVEE